MIDAPVLNYMMIEIATVMFTMIVDHAKLISRNF